MDEGDQSRGYQAAVMLLAGFAHSFSSANPGKRA